MTKGQRIKSKREELNISQTDFAKKINVSKQTLYKYENDIVTNIPSNKLEKIAAALGVDPSFLMGWDIHSAIDAYIKSDRDIAVLTDRIMKDHTEKDKKAKELYPDCKVLFRWNTRDCITLDKIPYIGEFSNLMKNMYKHNARKEDVVGSIESINSILFLPNPFNSIFGRIFVFCIKLKSMSILFLLFN